MTKMTEGTSAKMKGEERQIREDPALGLMATKISANLARKPRSPPQSTRQPTRATVLKIRRDELVTEATIETKPRPQETFPSLKLIVVWEGFTQLVKFHSQIAIVTFIQHPSY